MESKLHSDARQIEKKLKFSKPEGEIDFNSINFKLVEKLENIICLVSEGSVKSVNKKIQKLVEEVHRQNKLIYLLIHPLLFGLLSKRTNFTPQQQQSSMQLVHLYNRPSKLECFDQSWIKKLPSTLFKSKLEKIKKTHPEKISFIQGKLSFLANIKKFLIFSQKKAFLIFWGTETELSYFSESNFPSSKKNLIFWEMELSGLEKLNKTFCALRQTP